MKLALLSDIHANLEALEACLADATAQGATRWIILGDLVGYGADPGGVVERVRALEAQGAIVLRGNHDEAATHGPRGFSSAAATAMRWTMEQLPPGMRAWLDSLPLTVAEEDRLYTHADASLPADWRYVTDARAARRSLLATDARRTFCGHTHVPALFRMATAGKVVPLPPEMGPQMLDTEHRWLAVIGAVGQPRDGNPAAAYALLNTADSTFLTRRVPYDVAGAAAKIRAAGLPELLAERLFVGV